MSMKSISEHVFDRATFEAWAAPLRDALEEDAAKVLRTDDARYATLVAAMNYAVTGGGKRIRALLSYAAGALTGGVASDLRRVALALEFVHAYSLIHDDLPCMDNDTLRRGKPTCHVKFGVGEAMLAGDALQPEAFLLLTDLDITEAARLKILTTFAKACGRDGMCGGQAIDLEHVGKKIDLALLREMHSKKTGALITAAIMMGALCGDAERFKRAEPSLQKFSSAMGLGFQVVDDILDVTSTAATLGKTAGKDAENNKPTYVSLIGLEASERLTQETLKEALSALEELQEAGFDATSLEHLADLAYYMIGRTK
jgi:farnesyl diphosphate synthase